MRRTSGLASLAVMAAAAISGCSDGADGQRPDTGKANDTRSRQAEDREVAPRQTGDPERPVARLLRPAMPGGGKFAIAYGDTIVAADPWIQVGPRPKTHLRLANARTGVVRSSMTRGGVVGAAVGQDTVWLVDGQRGKLRALDRRSGRRVRPPIAIPQRSVYRTLDQGPPPHPRVRADGDYLSGPIAVGAGSVWVAQQRMERSSAIVRVDEGSGRRRPGLIRVGKRISSLAVGGRYLWAADHAGDAVWRVDPRTGRTSRQALTGGDQPVDVELAGGAVWVANQGSATVVRLRRGRPPLRIPVDPRPRQLAATPGKLWVVSDEGLIRALDLRTGARIDGSVRFVSNPGGLVAADSTVFALTRDETVRLQERGTQPSSGFRPRLAGRGVGIVTKPASSFPEPPADPPKPEEACEAQRYPTQVVWGPPTPALHAHRDGDVIRVRYRFPRWTDGACRPKFIDIGANTAARPGPAASADSPDSRGFAAERAGTATIELHVPYGEAYLVHASVYGSGPRLRSRTVDAPVR